VDGVGLEIVSNYVFGISDIQHACSVSSELISCILDLVFFRIE
jgi:hypothetical protein